MDVSPAGYDSKNGLQKADAKILVKRIKDFLGDRTVDLLVDFGCGPGNITVTLKKLLNCKRVIGFDINPKMIKFASVNYTNYNQGVDFEVCDAAATWKQFTKATTIDKNSTDVVFSVHCLHWIHVDQQPQAMSNMAKILKKGGRLFLTIAPWLGAMRKLCELIGAEDKWSPYVTNCPSIPTFDGLQKEPTREEVLKRATELAEGAGLRVVSLDYDVTKFEFEDKENFHDWARAVCWLLPKIPEKLRDEFLADYLAKLDAVCVVADVPSLTYKKLTLIAEKA